MLKILCVGPQWRGSNAGGLFRALSRIGNLISVVDENYYINLSNQKYKTKFIDKLFRGWHIREFNEAIWIESELFNPDIVLVYKGAFVLPKTLFRLKEKGIKVVNFYPDVSFVTHGNLLKQTLPLYDHIFTTKTFGVTDMKKQLGIECSSFIPHGFDPDIHKKIELDDSIREQFDCDVSFIGGWSKKKENILSAIKMAIPDIKLKIWGGRWEHCVNPVLKSSIQYNSILGDLYTMGILSSKINLGLLHERVKGSSSGDLITSRTFHIPGAGGFMIHEKTEELALYFEENKEVVCFSTEQELIEKITFYLGHDEERGIIQHAGLKRARNDHSLDSRAMFLLSKIKDRYA